MDQDQLKKLLLKYKKGQCTPEEARLIDEWYDAITTDQKPFDHADDEHHIRKRTWSVIAEAIDNGEQEKMPGKKLVALNPWSLVGIAAAIILMLTIALPSITTVSPRPTLNFDKIIAAENTRSVTNDGTEPLAVTLSDGSRITLSPESSIRYSILFAGPRRSVFLKGEALFEVARDEARPFVVYTHGLTTQVLGTSFRVQAYEEQEEIVVTVKTGKVAVYKNLIPKEQQDEKPEEVILTPNQQLVYKRDQMTAVKQLVEQPAPVVAQTAPTPTYNTRAVVEILKSLEETYAITIHYDSLALSECTLISDLSEEGFYEQIEILCNALGAEYQISEGAVTIKATGCSTEEKN